MLSDRKSKMYKRLTKLDYVLSGSFWGLLIIGGFSFIIGLILQIYKVEWAFVLTTIGQTALVSVLFTVISKSSFFLDFFSDILEDIIYSSGHVTHRDDKEAIWERITKCLFTSKVPGLHDEISKTIKDTYIPDSKISYYNNYRQLIDIVWVDREKKMLKTIDRFTFDLHTNDKERFCFERDNWIPKEKTEDYDARRKVTSYIVNGEDKTSFLKERLLGDESDEQIVGTDCYKVEVWLEGSTKYHIEQTTERTFCLDDDCYSGFKARWIVNDMDVRVSHPNDLDVKYISRGTADSFNIVKNDTNSLDIEYKGLILQNQGYILLFTEKKHL